MLTEKYFQKNPGFNSIIHIVIGIGIGILVTYPLIGAHPVRWGVFFLILGLVGHLYPIWTRSKKERG